MDSAYFVNTKHEKKRGIVKWKGYGDGEYVDNVECWLVDLTPISDLKTTNIEIVGSIYENPELFTTEKTIKLK